MTVSLPISIYICDNLRQKFAKIISISNKLEAQFNFQTMTANWYGDEDNLFFIQLYLETPQSFKSEKRAQKQVQQETQQQLNIHNYCDDVFSYDEKSATNPRLICHIAITHTELALLTQQSKVLEALLRVKLQKVLNLIAGQLKLNPI